MQHRWGQQISRLENSNTASEISATSPSISVASTVQESPIRFSCKELLSVEEDLVRATWKLWENSTCWRSRQAEKKLRGLCKQGQQRLNREKGETAEKLNHKQHRIKAKYKLDSPTWKHERKNCLFVSSPEITYHAVICIWIALKCDRWPVRYLGNMHNYPKMWSISKENIC